MNLYGFHLFSLFGIWLLWVSIFSSSDLNVDKRKKSFAWNLFSSNLLFICIYPSHRPLFFQDNLGLISQEEKKEKGNKEKYLKS